MEKDNSEAKKTPFFYPRKEEAQLSEEEKIEREKIANPIMTAFERVGQRYLERYISALNRASPKWKVELNEFAKQLGLLLSKRACAPGFYLYVLKKTTTSRKLKRQRATLTKAFLLSMLKQDGFRLEDIIEKPLRRPFEENDSEMYTRRQVQRIIHDYCPYPFFEINNSPIKRRIHEDERVKSLTTIFSAQEIPRTETSDVASQLAKADKQYWESNPLIKETIRHNAEINAIMPEYVEDLLSFREECNQIISQENFLIRDKYNKYLCAKNGDFTLLFEVFYRQVSSIMAQEWFLNQRLATRKAFIAKKFPFRYHSADAARARKLLLNLLQPEQQVNFLMTLCAISLQEQGLFNQSVILNKELLKSGSLSNLEKGIVLENIAVSYRNSKRFKLVIGYMKKALKEYEAAGDLYRVCVGWKNIGEAEWHMGFKESAWKFFKKAEENIPKLVDPMERFGVLWNLASAFRRIGNMKTESLYLTKCVEVLPDSETDKIFTILTRLRQLDKFL